MSNRNLPGLQYIICLEYTFSHALSRANSVGLTSKFKESAMFFPAFLVGSCLVATSFQAVKKVPYLSSLCIGSASWASLHSPWWASCTPSPPDRCLSCSSFWDQSLKPSSSSSSKVPGGFPSILKDEGGKDVEHYQVHSESYKHCVCLCAKYRFLLLTRMMPKCA